MVQLMVAVSEMCQPGLNSCDMQLFYDNLSHIREECFQFDSTKLYRFSGAMMVAPWLTGPLGGRVQN